MLEYFNFSFKAMGSSCELCLYAENHRLSQKVIDAAVESIRKLEQTYSRYLKNNLMYQINQAAGAGRSIKIDAETAALLNYADACYKNSGGLFDISSGVLREAWDFKSGQLPDQSHIDKLLDRVGWDKVSWKNPLLSFSGQGMELDFGGVVKEYAADQAATVCMEHGLAHGLINLGGDIRIIGPHPNGKSWSIGIRHPRDTRRAATQIQLAKGGVSSSGDYERCITIGDRFYSHILNPKTGWPVSAMASVTVIADLCLVAGSASTIAMLQDKTGENWLKENGFKALWIDVNGNMGSTFPNITF